MRKGKKDSGLVAFRGAPNSFQMEGGNSWGRRQFNRPNEERAGESRTDRGRYPHLDPEVRLPRAGAMLESRGNYSHDI